MFNHDELKIHKISLKMTKIWKDCRPRVRPQSELANDTLWLARLHLRAALTEGSIITFNKIIAVKYPKRSHLCWKITGMLLPHCHFRKSLQGNLMGFYSVSEADNKYSLLCLKDWLNVCQSAFLETPEPISYLQELANLRHQTHECGT